MTTALANDVERVATVVLMGDPQEARTLIQAAFPQAAIHVVTAQELRAERLRAFLRLRFSRPDAVVLFGPGAVERQERPAETAAACVLGADQLVFLEPSGKQAVRALAGRRARTVLRLAVEPFSVVFVLALGPLLRLSRISVRRRRFRPVPEGTGSGLRIAYLRSEVNDDIGIGGTFTHTVGIVRAFANMGHEVTAIMSGPLPDFDHPAVHTTSVPVEPTLFRLRPAREIEAHLRFFLRAWRLLRSHPPDFFFARQRRFDLSSPLLALVMGRPLVLEHEGPDSILVSNIESFSTFPKTLKSSDELSHSVAGRILTVSSEVSRQLTADYGVPPAKLVVTRSGVDTARFAPGCGGSERRRSLGIPDSAIVLGFCGTFAPWHGVDVLVDAVAGLSEEAGLSMLLVGDGESRPTLERRLAGATAARTTHFTGFVPLGEMPSHLDACDILACPTQLLPGQTEFFGSPTKLFEYMAVGKAVVASDLGQISEVIDDGRNGLLVPERDPVALGAAIMRLVHEPELRLRLGRAARADVVANGSWEHNAQIAIDGAMAAREPAS